VSLSQFIANLFRLLLKITAWLCAREILFGYVPFPTEFFAKYVTCHEESADYLRILPKPQSMRRSSHVDAIDSDIAFSSCYTGVADNSVFYGLSAVYKFPVLFAAMLPLSSARQ